MSILEEGTDLAFAVDQELNVAAEYVRRGMTGTAGFRLLGRKHRRKGLRVATGLVDGLSFLAPSSSCREPEAAPAALFTRPPQLPDPERWCSDAASAPGARRAGAVARGCLGDRDRCQKGGRGARGRL